ncbi:MAG TPA: ATP-binding protein [Steroidobacteraceae bacterium]|nr:ATP-binding protein [Steroidobacteraceae bacterium]
MARFSLEGKVALLSATCAGLTAAIALALEHALGLTWLSLLLTLVIAVPLIVIVSQRFARPIRATLRAVADGVSSLRDSDFSISIAGGRRDELGELVAAYNSLGSILRDERQDLFQRELLLDTVIQSTPLALVLTNNAGRVLYSNLAARQLFHAGRKLEGLDLSALLEAAPAALRDAFGAERDTLFTVPIGGEPEIFHLSRRGFLLNANPHHLYLLKQLTRELNAQEVATWKKVIRVIAHELNNSLAPISSLAHSGRLLAHAPQADKLDRVFATIEERAAHLKTFIDGYARFAKLPQPRIIAVNWNNFLELLSAAVPFRIEGEVPREAAEFDTAQLQQVLINLLKNAHESGSAPEEVRISIEAGVNVWQLNVLDRGSGMSEAVLRNALLPFYSTKPTGTGLGLTLSREVLEAHGGRITLANREGGGLVVALWLPRSAGVG